MIFDDISYEEFFRMIDDDIVSSNAIKSHDYCPTIMPATSHACTFSSHNSPSMCFCTPLYSIPSLQESLDQLSPEFIKSLEDTDWL